VLCTKHNAADNSIDADSPVNTPSTSLAACIKVLPVLTSTRVLVKPHLHDTTGCQYGCTTGLYRVNKYPTGCQTSNRLSNCLSNRFDNRVERTATVPSTSCQAGLYNRFDNRFDNRLCRVSGALRYSDEYSSRRLLVSGSPSSGCRET